MRVGSGKWLRVEDYILATGLGESEVRKSIEDGRLISKVAVGVEYVWSESPAPDGSEDSSGAEAPDDKAGHEVIEGEAMLSGYTGVRELAHQAERSIALVDRSLQAFMMMHEEVIEAKDRFVEQSREGLIEKDRVIEEDKEKIQALEQALRERDQEIADLKMLVDILEGRSGRKEKTEELHADERASVGDLMEDQLKYIMEDQMVKELLKE